MASAAETTAEPACPEPLRQETKTTYVIRDRIWKPANRENNWAAFVMVGREGSGKSHTTARILRDVDPTFDAERVFFDPVDLIKFINDLDEDERQGKAVMLDEAGVGMGVRSWYEKDQINVNKAFQTLRDDNMIVALTLPSFGLLDSQLRPRLHGFCEMRALHDGDYAVWSWKDIVVNREEEGNEIKRKVFPRRTVGGRVEKIERCAIGPPDEAFIGPYEARKAEFKSAYMEEVIEENEADEDGEERGPKEIAEEIIAEDRIEEFTSVHGGRGTEYVDKDKVYMHYDGLTHNDAQLVKKLLAESWEPDNE